jgi:hypothetical protein
MAECSIVKWEGQLANGPHRQTMQNILNVEHLRPIENLLFGAGTFYTSY